jgi:hypothetical protein
MAAPAVAAPIPGHPPVDMTGIVASVDTTTGVVTFKDGRMAKLTSQSKVLKAAETATVRPGEQVVVRNALPVAVQSASATSKGKRQKMATVASVDHQNQIVRMTDGSAVQVTPSTGMRVGTSGVALVLADLRPGDEVVIVMADTAPTAGGTSSSATAASSASSGASPSALPRVVAPPMPPDAVELMVFREWQAP